MIELAQQPPLELTRLSDAAVLNGPGLGNIATQAEAEAGADPGKVMTPQAASWHFNARVTASWRDILTGDVDPLAGLGVNYAIQHPPGPIYWNNNVNADVQIGNPGPGAVTAQYGSFENASVQYGPEGTALVGPGARPDIRLIAKSFHGIDIRHQHIWFDRPQHSANKPDPRLTFVGSGGATFTLGCDALGSYCQLDVPGVGAGETALLYTDPLRFLFVSGTWVHFTLWPSAATQIWIDVGVKSDDDLDEVFLSANVGAAAVNWQAKSKRSTAPAGETTINGDVPLVSERLMFAVAYNRSVVEFYCGTPFVPGVGQNTMRLIASIATNIPAADILTRTFTRLRPGPAPTPRNVKLYDFYTAKLG